MQTQAAELGDLLNKFLEENSCEILGPAPLPLYRLRGHFRWHLMLRGPESAVLRGVLRKALIKLKKKRDVFISIDVDPISIL